VPRRTSGRRPRRAIVAIGGGEIRTRGTAPIDREIIRLTGKRHPSLLFIPTASSDSERYWRHVREYFGGFLKCRTNVLFLIRQRPRQAEIRRAILSADIVYVGGGNTLMMMRLWRRLGVDRMLRTAYDRGVVLCGVSAGSICWFDAGHSDSMSFYDPGHWQYIKVRGLGLIPGVHCPHYNSRTRGVPRRRDFREMIRKTGGVGIAIENNCAIAFIDGTAYRVLTSKSYAGAYRVTRRGGQVVSSRILKLSQLTPMSALRSVGARSGASRGDRVTASAARAVSPRSTVGS
jgi:dipeptidase E